MEITQILPKDLEEDSIVKWDEFCIASDAAGIELPDDPSLQKEIKWVFGLSDFVSKTASLKPDLFVDLIKSGDLNRQYTNYEYADHLKLSLKNATDDDELGHTLRQVRCREMIRIAFRDLLCKSDLLETMADLSWFADACIDHALAFLYKQHCLKFGTPVDKDGISQNIVVLGMGKLGGRELNFSSDVDLIFAYPEIGETVNGPQPISNNEFFTSLCQRFLKLFGVKTSEGILFRVDMRLRPFGENGPLVTSFNSMEQYYQRQGREWERYAFIKARTVAGDKKAGAILLERLRPFIYRRYLDYGVYEALREMKEKIALEVERKGLQSNIKLGPGGIREIEFFGQVFQLIRGGVESVLQKRRILKVLEILASEGYIPEKVCKELTEAYIFLRNTEHRLQEFSDQQTHELPSDPLGKIRLAVSMGCDSWESFTRLLKKHTGYVKNHFDELLADEKKEAQEKGIESELDNVWKEIVEQEHAHKILVNAGFAVPGDITGLLDFLRNDSETRALSREGRNRLDKLMPLVLKKVALSEQPELTLKRIVDLIKTIERRSCYISLLLEKPDVLNHLVKLSNASPWIISFLARRPVLLDELLDPRSLYTPPEREELEKALYQRMKRVPKEDLEQQLEELAIFSQANTLRVAAADVTGAFPLMKVSDYLSYIAENILSEVLKISWDHLVEKHGKPVFITDNKEWDKGFAVIAYGKLGGLELGYGSDLDLVFLHAGKRDKKAVNKGLIDAPQFYAKLGQRVLHLLTAHTRAGRLYEIDMRLRPSGSSGLLVSNLDSFREYQMNDAWTWEHQALVRARAICGDKKISELFEGMRKDILCTRRDKGKLKEEITSMRERMRKEHNILKPGNFNIKQDRGGIVDIEFLVQYLVLLNAHKNVKLVRWSDNIRQLEALAETKILGKQTALFLKDAYLTLRSKIHRLSLQEKPAIVPEEKFSDLQNEVQEVWNQYLG